ncbi:MAG: hypothetical protein OHK0050_15290 [Roseiflexaceae bacterium]
MSEPVAPETIEPPAPAELSIHMRPWEDPETFPPTDLPSEDGVPMESPWHAGSGPLIKSAYLAHRGGVMTDFYIGMNMFVYYSWKQVRDDDYRGPDLYFVEGVDGQKPRRYWAIWDEDGRYPDMVIELLSASTEKEDLTTKHRIYLEQFRLREYFCIASECSQLFGWRNRSGSFEAISPNEQGWLWSEYLGLWIGPWQGIYMGEEHTWPRLYHPDGSLVLLAEESEQQRAEQAVARAEAEQQRAEQAVARAEAEQQRAEQAVARAEAEQQRAAALAERLAALEAELAKLRGE